MTQQKPTLDQIFEDELSQTQQYKLTKLQLAQYHVWNPHGVVSALPTIEDFKTADGGLHYGLYKLYSTYDSWHGKQLRAIANGEKKKFNRWSVVHHVDGVLDEIKEARAALAEKAAA